ncbi:sialic acid-binding Ig-like lectin 14 isoform 2-T2 [Odontesthes bonariensis]|uniref:sialic acid-binding Ig-like lectin 14 isoform X2 n=1 Tax=Odontesthes bonariensis TaxID=219752 RepID=UPI003F58FEEE
MFVLIWATVFFSVRGSNADTGSSIWGKQYCQHGYCITLSEREITAEAGLSVVIPCSFTTANGFTPQHLIWYKCEHSRERCDNSDIIFDSDESGFRGRVSLVEPDVSQTNCSILINDVRQSDSGSYQLRVNGLLNGKTDGFTYSPRANVSVKGSSVWGKQYCQHGYCITLSEREITAEAGLSVVIPCSFTTAYGFTPQHLVWYKCEHSRERCDNSDIIFDSDKTNQRVQTGFRGRVSLVEPDVSHTNCSIVINDVGQSDSGSYQLRVNGLLNGKTDGFTYSPRANVSVKGLNQKPTLMVPPLTEGQQTTLTCTAPGSCSGSHPKITWSWRGAGEKDSAITQNISAETSNLTALKCRHSSFVTFNPSAEHHNTNVTCKINFAGGRTTEETVTLNVKYMKEVKVTGDRSVMEGETLNLTCSVDSFPPSSLMWTKLNSCTTLPSNTGSATFVIPNVTAEHSGLYVCTAKYLNMTVITHADVTVRFDLGKQSGILPWAIAGTQDKR